MEETPLTRRRWFRFSLRTFLIVITLVGFGGAWVGMQLQQKRRHEAVVNEIVKLRGNVYLMDVEYLSVWKEWLFGSYAVKRVTLDLDTKDATDSLLSETQGMNIVALVLSSSKISDAGLPHLKGLTSLEELGLENTPVTDAGLTHLQGLTNLEAIDLSNTRITDAGLTHLEGLTRLQYLYLNDTQVTQAGVDRLQKTIPGCQISYEPKETISAPSPRPQPWTAKQGASPRAPND